MTQRIWTMLSLATLLLIQSSVYAGSDVIVWRLATVFSSDVPILTTGARSFAANVNKASAGRLRIEIDDWTVHKTKPSESLDLVVDGTYQMVHTTALYYGDQQPAFYLLSGMPFGFTPMEHYAWLYEGGGQELMQELFAPFGVIAFSAGNTGMQMGGWFKREGQNTTGPRERLRMRIAGYGGQLLEAVGGEAVRLPGRDIRMAFDSDKINAAEFVGPAIDANLQLDQVAPYYYAPWNQPSVAQQFLISESEFADLPADLQAIVEISARAATLDSLTDGIAQNAKAWQEMQSERAVAVRSFSPETAKTNAGKTRRFW